MTITLSMRALVYIQLGTLYTVAYIFNYIHYSRKLKVANNFILTFPFQNIYYFKLILIARLF